MSTDKNSKAYAPPPFTAATIRAMQALFKGEADDIQQKHALDWIIRHAARKDDLPFRPGGLEGDRETAFACGRMFVGQEIVKLINMTPQFIRELETKE